MIVVRKSQLKELEKKRKRSNLNMLAAGVLIGLTIGSLIALLLAPTDGENTRLKIKDGARSLGDKCKDLFGNGCCCGSNDEACDCELDETEA